MKTCIFCGQESAKDEWDLGNPLWNGYWVLCPLCGQPNFDITIQDEDHWIFDIHPEYLKHRGKYD